MRFDSSRAQLAQLLVHYDAGAFTLPDEVVAARRSVVRLEQLSATITVPDIEAEREKLIAGLTSTARGTGSKYPDAGRVADTIAAVTRAEELSNAVTEATTRETNRLSGLLSGGGQDIIVKHLRPAHDKAVADARAAVKAIAAVGADPGEVCQAAAVVVADELQAPRHTLGLAAATYGAVGDARRRIVATAGGPQQDGRGEFSWCKNLASIWPGHVAYNARPPWPDDALGVFLWRLASGATLWCPTLEQQDAAFVDAHAAGLALQTHARAASVGGIFAG